MSDRKHATSPTKSRALLANERNRKIFDLRIAGASERKIAEQLGMNSSSVHVILHKIVDEMNRKLEIKASHLKRIELERLDSMMLSLWANRNDPRATDSLLRIMERRARYTGIEMPIEVRNMNRDESADSKAKIAKLPTKDLETIESILAQLESKNVDDNDPKP